MATSCCFMTAIIERWAATGNTSSRPSNIGFRDGVTRAANLLQLNRRRAPKRASEVVKRRKRPGLAADVTRPKRERKEQGNHGRTPVLQRKAGNKKHYPHVPGVPQGRFLPDSL